MNVKNFRGKSNTKKEPLNPSHSGNADAFIDCLATMWAEGIIELVHLGIIE